MPDGKQKASKIVSYRDGSSTPSGSAASTSAPSTHATSAHATSAHATSGEAPSAKASNAGFGRVTTGTPRRRSPAMPIDNPHELLGLVAGEKNVLAIIEAARARLSRIRAANGSEVAVRAYVIGHICRARAAMLKEARRATAGRDRIGDPSAGKKP